MKRLIFLALAASCVSIRPGDELTVEDTGEPLDTPAEVDTPDDTLAPPDTVPEGLPWTDDPCANIPRQGEVFGDDVARFRAQDDANPPPPGQLVLVGSSSIRRWEGAMRELAPWGLVQRGIGGARMGDIASWVDDLVIRHRPRGVVLFAGTNDVAYSIPPADIVTGYRCVVQRVFDALGPTPVVFIGITPTPSRWELQAVNDEVNAEIRRLSDLHPQLWYADIPAAFLATGGPPEASLFVDDGLHLSPSGYDLWSDALLPVVDDAIPRRMVPTPIPVAPGSYVRVDFGPDNPEDGARAPAVDRFGIHWNAWHPMTGGSAAIAGEALRGLVTTSGESTSLDLVLTGGFRANGLRNGGLASPSYDRLGTMAVPEATGDFFYIEDPDDPGGFSFTGLDPAATYRLRLFASRAIADARRVTRYVVEGAGLSTSGDLLTSGPDIGANGWDGNDNTVLTLSDLRPDAWGQLYVDVQRGEGGFGYVSLLELEVVAP